ncbi:MAG: hypothetical protein NVSMB31_10100 [Vulcanimicrobiaceae bacterium]
MADFVSAASKFNEAKISVVFASADPREDAVKMQKAEGVPFTVAYGIDARWFSKAFGAFFADEEAAYIHATAFAVDQEGRVTTAVYSTGALGRLTAAEALKT